MKDIENFINSLKDAKEFIDELVSVGVATSGDFPSLDKGTVTKKKKDGDEDEDEKKSDWRSKPGIHLYYSKGKK